MGKRTLGVYIDESGVLDKENPTSRFYLISLVATLRFIELKMRAGLPMTKSEYRFFGGPRRFRHDILRAIKDHWLD